MARDANWLDRAVGAVVGGAAGDALGAGYEFTTPSPETPIGMIGGGIGAFEPGEWTDDTAQAAAVLQGVGAGEVDLERIGAGFLDWYADGPKDVGISTGAVLRAAGGRPERLTAAADEYFRDHPKGAAGNGSLMRTAPVAIAHLGDDQAIAAAARAVSRLTHGDPLAADACVLWCIAIDRAVREGRLDGVWDGLALLDASARDAWSARLSEAEEQPPARFRNNGFVVVALQAAYASVIQTPVPREQRARHLQDALEVAVRIGHDTDTVAAIAGQLLGARWGVSAVPAAWRLMLHGWPGWDVRDLVRASVTAARGGRDDRDGWPSATSMLEWGRRQEGTPVCAAVPGANGLYAGNLPGLVEALETGIDVVVSLCRVGSADVPSDVEHLEVWLSDRGGDDDNPNLDFLLDDTSAAIGRWLDDGKRVYVHCVGGRSRTPTVVAAVLAQRGGMSRAEAFESLRAVLPVADHNGRFGRWRTA